MDPAVARNDRSLDAPERSRARSRSMATLAASAAGVVAAGLVFRPESASIGSSAKFSGFIALSFLLISTAAYAWASLYAKKITGKSEHSAAKTLTLHIRRISLVGSIAGLGSIVALAVMVAFTIFTEPERIPITVGFEGEPLSRLCPDLPHEFTGTASLFDLHGSGAYLKVTVDAGACRQGSPRGSVIDIYLDRATAQVIAGSPQ